MHTKRAECVRLGFRRASAYAQAQGNGEFNFVDINAGGSGVHDMQIICYHANHSFLKEIAGSNTMNRCLYEPTSDCAQRLLLPKRVEGYVGENHRP